MQRFLEFKVISSYDAGLVEHINVSTLLLFNVLRTFLLFYVFVFIGFCKDLLDVADVLQKAVEAVKTEDEKSGGNLASGIELTQTQMYQVFNRHGLSQIAPVLGETKFDPNMHEALFQVPSPDKGMRTQG